MESMIFALGSNGSGQLGLGHIEDVSIPSSVAVWDSSIRVNATPKAIVSGGNHTLILSSLGKLYITGVAATQFASTIGESDGRLCLLTEDVGCCAASWETSIFVSGDGSKIFTCGRGAKGELGQGPDVQEMSLDLTRPLAVPCSTNGDLLVKGIAAGVQHAVVVLSDGTIYGWGNGRKGQLGEPPGIIWHPRKIEDVDFKVSMAVCGREFTYLVGEPSTGSHTVLGSNKWGIKSKAPQNIREWIQVGAGWSSISVLLKDGTIKSWGRDDHGQMAPAGLPPITMLAVGSEHTLALSKNGKILAWGWGEHGNCGVDTDEHGDVKGKWNELKISSSASVEPVGCSAGCATSWIWA